MQMAAEFSLDVILREFSPVEELIIFAQKEKTLEMVFFWEVGAKEFGLDVTVVMSSSLRSLKVYLVRH